MTINGRHIEIDASHEAALEVLRADLGLTGTKLVCGTGVCGACTIAVDGVAVASCILPAEDLEGADVLTIEGVADGADLHPVQSAFLSHDALQCGYCTPGFVVEAVLFHDRWREERGTTRPTREEIARALAGHLCRCGAYDGIYRAVASACAGEFDNAAAVDPPRPDGREKVTGEARYTTDVHLDALVGRIVRARVAHGEVKTLDLRPALEIEGVLAAVTLVETGERIRYRGQELAAVAAVDEATARRAVESVIVHFDELPAAIGAVQALAEEAPDVHGWWIPPSNNEAPAVPNLRRKNLVGPTLPPTANPWRVKRRLGRAEKEDRVVGDRWETSVVSHTAFEPHAAVAEWRRDGTLRVYMSTQGIWDNRRRLANELGLATDQVEVVANYVGGAFGAKQALGTEPVVAALLAREADRPVRVVLDRWEELTVGGNRPGAAVDLSAAYDEQGDLEAMSIRSVADGGASAGSLVASSLPRFLYPGAPRMLLDFDAVSNLPPGTAFRAPGGPPAFFALEGAVDEVAARTGIDPIDLRRRWDRRPLREAMYDWVQCHPTWLAREDRGAGRFRRGVGAAFGSWFQGHDPAVEVTVETGSDGIRVSVAAQDMGNGTRGVLASAVAPVFGVDEGDVTVDIGSSAASQGPMSSGSRTTASLWPAARSAAEQAVNDVVERLDAAGLTGAQPVPGGVMHAGELLPWEEVLGSAGPVKVTSGRPRDTQRLAPFRHRIGGLQFGRGLTESAHVVETEVDTRLGSVQVLRVDTALAAGRIHNPELAHSQVVGGVVQGLGMALYEQRRVDFNTGAVMTATLEDYLLPGIADTPEMDVRFIEWGFEHVAGGGVGMSELALVAVPAAVASSVRSATGRRFGRLPITPSMVIAR